MCAGVTCALTSFAFLFTANSSAAGASFSFMRKKSGVLPAHGLLPSRPKIWFLMRVAVAQNCAPQNWHCTIGECDSDDATIVTPVHSTPMRPGVAFVFASLVLFEMRPLEDRSGARRRTMGPCGTASGVTSASGAAGAGAAIRVMGAVMRVACVCVNASAVAVAMAGTAGTAALRDARPCQAASAGGMAEKSGLGSTRGRV